MRKLGVLLAMIFTAIFPMAAQDKQFRMETPV